MTLDEQRAVIRRAREGGWASDFVEAWWSAEWNGDRASEPHMSLVRGAVEDAERLLGERAVDRLEVLSAVLDAESADDYGWIDVWREDLTLYFREVMP